MVLDEPRNADVLVFATPVHMGQMTGLAKTFMDRPFPTDSPKFSPYRGERSKKKLFSRVDARKSEQVEVQSLP
jgi:multimeric flavodoxin WrbA